LNESNPTTTWNYSSSNRWTRGMGRERHAEAEDHRGSGVPILMPG